MEKTLDSMDNFRIALEVTRDSIARRVRSNEMDGDRENMAIGRLNVDETPHKEDTDSPEFPMWANLPQKAGTAFEGIGAYLRTDGDCSDLAKFSMVCPDFRAGVLEWVGRKDNRLAVKGVYVDNSEDGLKVEIHLFLSNLPFYDMNKLDWGRFERRMEYADYAEDSDCSEEGGRMANQDVPILEVTLTGPEDPIIEQMIDLLSARIKIICIGDDIDHLTKDNLSLAEQLLRNSSIAKLHFAEIILDDDTVPNILSLASHTDYIILYWFQSDLSDSAAFFTQLYSLPIYRFDLTDINSPSSSFFGFPSSFWETFLNEKLSNGSMRWVKVNEDKKIRKAPINLPNSDLYTLEWKKFKAK